MLEDDEEMYDCRLPMWHNPCATFHRAVTLLKVMLMSKTRRCPF
jgi:hypothetical protein